MGLVGITAALVRHASDDGHTLYLHTGNGRGYVSISCDMEGDPAEAVVLGAVSDPATVVPLTTPAEFNDFLRRALALLITPKEP